MQPACTALHALLPEGATALEIPTDRPAFVKSFKRPRIFPAATAVSLVASPSARRAPRPESAVLYVNQPTCTEDDDPRIAYAYVTTGTSPRSAEPGPFLRLGVFPAATVDRLVASGFARRAPRPDMEDEYLRVAYAYITPDTSPCRAEPGPFLRLVFRTLALDLPQTFEILAPRFGADAAVRFRTKADREAAMRRQPFQLDGATVELVPFRLINVARTDAGSHLMAHVALHEYPVQERSEKEIMVNCSRFGSVREIGAAEPGISTVCAILQLEDPREIPYELHIECYNGFTSVVPVEILSVWECSKSFDANGEYVHML